MIRAIIAKIRGLLVWTILTASTIGPGTVAMCSKAGSDFGNALLWCVVVASATAMVMQEASARLTIHADLTLGQALRHIVHKEGFVALYAGLGPTFAMAVPQTLIFPHSELAC